MIKDYKISKKLDLTLLSGVLGSDLEPGSRNRAHYDGKYASSLDHNTLTNVSLLSKSFESHTPSVIF